MGEHYHPEYLNHRMSPAILAEIARPLYRKMLSVADARLRDQQSEIAVVFAQAAAELCMEHALDLLLQVHGVDFLFEPLSDFFASSDICNDRVRRVYAALSGDDIVQQAFWQDLKEHKKRRNAIVHKGSKCSKEDSRESINAVKAYVQHVEHVLDEARKNPDRP